MTKEDIWAMLTIFTTSIILGFASFYLAILNAMFASILYLSFDGAIK